MSKFKFKSIKSTSKILRLVKRDLWNNIILTNSNKFKRIFSKLYGKKRRYINKVFKQNYIKNFLIISKGRLINKRFFGAYLVKKARKRRVTKYKKLLNKKLISFDKIYFNNKKTKNKVETLSSKLSYLSTLEYIVDKNYITKLEQQLQKLKTTLLTLQLTQKQLRKKISKILKKLKFSFFFKKVNLKKKKVKKRKKKLQQSLKSSKSNYVTEEQQMVYLIEMLKLKKKNYKLHIKLKKDKILTKLKKKKDDLIKKLGEDEIEKIDDIITNDLIKYQTIFKLDNYIKATTKKPKAPKSKISKQITELRKIITKTKNVELKKVHQERLIYLQKRRRNLEFIKSYYIYKENYKKTEDYKNKFDLKTLTAKKYDNSYFLKKYKNFFSKLLRNRYKPNFYDLSSRLTKRRQYKSILNLSYIKTYKKQVKTTKFGKALNQQQTLKRYLGNLSSKKLKKLYLFFKGRKISKNRYNFFLNLESTLFYTLIRSKLFTNYHYLNRIITKGYVQINGTTVTDKFYKLNPLDKITFTPFKVKFLKLRFLSYYISKLSKPTSNLIVSYSTYSVLFLKYPPLVELTYNFKISYDIFKSIYKKY